MSFRHIIVRMRDDDIINARNTVEKNKCILKKMDYLNCVKSHPRQYDCFAGKINKNKCTQLFWNWYKICKDTKNIHT